MALNCDPTGPFRSCGGNRLFDSNATCQVSDAYLYEGTSWCTQVHCCKFITQEEMLKRAIGLDGTKCHCKKNYPCISVQHGECMGSGHVKDYQNDRDIIRKCFDKRSSNSVPCVNGAVTIPLGI